MPLGGLGPELAGARLAHISDLHCCPIVRERYLHHCINAVNKLDVDFVAITGDFITGPRRYAHRVARVLSELRCRVAAVACLGNHDYGICHPRGLGGNRGLADYLADELSQRDIFVVRNEVRAFRVGDSEIQFVGLEDYWSGQYNPHVAFEMSCRNLPTIALCHNPDAALQVAHFGASWVLAGHTHGQKTPDTRFHDLIVPTNHKQFAAGHYPLGNDKHLYVNRGLGYARRINLNSRPEITLFTLVSDTAAPNREVAGRA
jgi:predicted MPP superfamily phosphohydrolase